MKTFVARTSIKVDEPETVLKNTLAHLLEHELPVEQVDDRWSVGYRDYGRGSIWIEGGVIHAEARAEQLEYLHDIKMVIAGHLLEFSGREGTSLPWEGDGGDFTRPPAFRALTVQSVTRLSPHFCRVRFSCPDLARYDQDENLHCKLLFPQPGVTEPEWPSLAPNGLPTFPKGEKRLDMRTYTIRAIDAEAQWLDVDFVLHDDAGPGSRWAAQAQPGQLVGMSGPGGRTARVADRMVLAGDETALPAMLRIAAALPDSVRCDVLAEIGGLEDELPLSLPAGVTWTWLHRGDQPAGTTSLLIDRVQALPWQGEDGILAASSRFVWVGAEFETAQRLRGWVRDELGVGKLEQLIVAYWRRGMSENEFKAAAR